LKLYKIELTLYNYDDNVKTEIYMQELSITEDALERIKLIQSQEGKGFLRITVDGGGCSGFSYSFNFDNKQLEDDIIASIDKNGHPALVTDNISLNYLSGSEITWKEDLSGASFSIDNPIATSSCGCGTSFSVT
jgi:iron-sulfur cluster assembly accessory protein